MEKTSDSDQLFRELGMLRDRGQGYVEIRVTDFDSVQLTVGFQEGHAVVHLIDGEEMFLLVGDGSVSESTTVEVPIMGEPALFTGEFVMGLDRAWSAIRGFLASGSSERLGEWREL